IATPKAGQVVRSSLADPDFLVRVAAARAVGLARDREAVSRLLQMVKNDQPAVRRQAATAVGQIGKAGVTSTLLAASASSEDRFVEHAFIDALIRLRDTVPLVEALNQPDPKVRKAALIALDQMDGSPLKKKQAAFLLADESAELRRTALWVITHHPDWADAVLDFLRVQLRSPRITAGGADSVRGALLAFCSDSQVQQMVADVLGSAGLAPERHLFLLDIINGCSLK